MSASSLASTAQSHLAPLLPLLACPLCGIDLPLAEECACAACERVFPIRDGVPDFGRFGSAEKWGGEQPMVSSADYQGCYRELDDASEYNEMYAGRLAKRCNTAREGAILRRLLARFPRSGVLLDLPCGGGRLSRVLASYTDILLEADIAFGQVLYARRHGTVDGTKQAWMTASGFHIPLRTGSVDGVVCVRLCHHLPAPEERERLVAELLRVARSFVIMTFFDHHSLKNLLRRIRRPFNGKPAKSTMTVEQVRALAGRNGAELVAAPALSLLNSGHRYALMVKCTGGLAPSQAPAIPVPLTDHAPQTA